MSARMILISGITLLFAAIPAPAAAQGFGPRSPDRMFRWLDQNENGTLEEDELQRFAPLKDFLEGRGVDLSHPMSLDDFASQMDVFRRKMERRAEDDGAGTGNGGFFGRRDLPPEGFGGGGMEGGARFRSFGGGGFVAASAGEDSDDETPASTPEKKPKPAPVRNRPSVTVKLPEEYRSKDKNGDGQIGLYEWSKSDLATFRKLDLNGDGFITPAELARGSSKSSGLTSSSGSSSGSSSSSGGSSSGSSSTSGSSSSGSSSGGSSSSSTSGSSSGGGSGAADIAFSLLDKDKDGKVTAGEWERSLSVRPKFEKAGLTPTLPMNKDEFLKLHAKLK